MTGHRPWHEIRADGHRAARLRRARRRVRFWQWAVDFTDRHKP